MLPWCREIPHKARDPTFLPRKTRQIKGSHISGDDRWTLNTDESREALRSREKGPIPYNSNYSQLKPCRCLSTQAQPAQAALNELTTCIQYPTPPFRTPVDFSQPSIQRRYEKLKNICSGIFAPAKLLKDHPTFPQCRRCKHRVFFFMRAPYHLPNR